MKVIIDVDKLSYTTLERIGRDYGYETVEEIEDRLMEDTESFKRELTDAVAKIAKSITIDFIKNIWYNIIIKDKKRRIYCYERRIWTI